MGEHVLPEARFEFIGDFKKRALPEEPPMCMDIAIISYWRMILRSELELKRSWIHKLVHLFKSKSTQTWPLGHRPVALPGSMDSPPQITS
jgi:hypothetical protein